MQSRARTVDEYLAELPPDRRDAIAQLVALVRGNLPKGYAESMQYGMIGWGIPLSRYPNTYNGQPLGIAALASQKQYMALYLMGVYADPAIEKWFREAWKKSGKKLDMGKSCVRFKSVDDLALDVLAEVLGKFTPEQFIARYEEVKGAPAAKKAAPKKTAAKKPATKKPAATKPAAKKAGKARAR